MVQLTKTIHEVIFNEITENSKVLDLGCGDGKLLSFLIKHKFVKGHGIDINSNAIIKCIEKGIPVIQWDLNNLPLDFPDKSYDFTILNQAISQVKNPNDIILELLRVGKESVVGFENFGNFDVRMNLLLSGKAPVTTEIPYKWYNTPNIHFLTTKDFIEFCKENKIKIKNKVFLKKKFNSEIYKEIKYFTNLRSDLAVFRIEKI
jgi:methionine biosynthesis protein MetW